MSRKDNGSEPHVFRVSSREVIALLSMLYSAVLFAPIRMFSVAENSAWISGLLSGVFGALIVYILVRLATSFPGQILPQIVKTLLGSWVGWIVNLVFCVYFFFEMAVAARMIGEATLRILPETPLFAIVTTALVVGAVIARLGVEVLGRMAIISFGVLAFTFAFIVFSLGRFVQLTQFLPVFADGVGPVVNASLTPTAQLAHVVVLTFFLPYLQETAAQGNNDRPSHRAALTVGMMGMGVAWFYYFLLLVLEQAVLSPQEAARLSIPAFSLLRAIEIGLFFERVEAAFVAVWFPAIMLTLSVFLYVASVTLKHLAASKSYRWYVVPLSALGVPAAITLADNVPKLAILLNGTWAVFALIVKGLVPLLMLGVAVVRMRDIYAK